MQCFCCLYVCALNTVCTSGLVYACKYLHCINYAHNYFIIIIAEPEGEATNLDAQVAERLYICMFICIYVRQSQLRTPRSWAQIVSVAIPMTSSCSIYLYNVLNPRFRLLPILSCTGSGQFGERLWQSVHHFLLLVPVRIPPSPGMLGKMASVTRKGFLVCGDQRSLGSENPLIAQLLDAGYTLAI